VICIERNNIEIALRDIVRITYRFIFKNEACAKEEVIKKLYGNSIEGKKLLAHPYAALFDPKKNNIYLKDITTLIKANYEYFSDYFGDIEYFIHAMDVLNKEGRFDAHAKIPDDMDLNSFQVAIDRISSGIRKFKEGM